MEREGARGATLIDVMTGVIAIALLLGMAVPLLRIGSETTEVQAAAAFLLGRTAQTRARAVLSGAAVGLVFRQDARGALIRTHIDGDGDGIHASDISDGIDRPIEPAWRLRDNYPMARLGLDPTVPPVGHTQTTASAAGVPFGPSGILTFSPLGTSSSGTLYVRGESTPDQYAIRIFGVTARARLLRFHPVTRTWGKP